jgi:hypothetical protein
MLQHSTQASPTPGFQPRNSCRRKHTGTSLWENWFSIFSNNSHTTRDGAFSVLQSVHSHYTCGNKGGSDFLYSRFHWKQWLKPVLQQIPPTPSNSNNGFRWCLLLIPEIHKHTKRVSMRSLESWLPLTHCRQTGQFSWYLQGSENFGVRRLTVQAMSRTLLALRLYLF